MANAFGVKELYGKLGRTIYTLRLLAESIETGPTENGSNLSSEKKQI